MRQLALDDIVRSLATATRTPHMAIQCSSVGFISLLDCPGLDHDTVQTLARTGWAMLSFSSFVDGALCAHEIEQQLAARDAKPTDVVFTLVHADGTVRSNAAG